MAGITLVDALLVDYYACHKPGFHFIIIYIKLKHIVKMNKLVSFEAHMTKYKDILNNKGINVTVHIYQKNCRIRFMTFQASRLVNDYIVFSS